MALKCLYQSMRWHPIFSLRTSYYTLELSIPRPEVLIPQSEVAPILQSDKSILTAWGAQTTVMKCKYHSLRWHPIYSVLTLYYSLKCPYHGLKCKYHKWYLKVLIHNLRGTYTIIIYHSIYILLGVNTTAWDAHTPACGSYTTFWSTYNPKWIISIMIIYMLSNNLIYIQISCLYLFQWLLLNFTGFLDIFAHLRNTKYTCSLKYTLWM